MNPSPRILNDNRLRYFFEVLTSGSIRGAADKLNVSASVVTRQIQQFERELGYRLLERRGRNVVPTEAAELVLEHCRERWASEEMLFARLDELRGLQRGEIRIVAGEGFIDEVSRALSFDFCQRYPNINLKVEQVSSYDVVPMILQDEAHLGLSFCAPSTGAVRVIRAKRLPVGLVAWPDHPLVLQGGAIALKDVLPYRVALMQEQFGVRKLVMAAEYAERVQFIPSFTANSLAVLKNHVKARMAVTFMSARAVATEVAAGELATVRIENAVLEAPEIQLIVRSGRVTSAALLQVQRCLGALPMFADD